MENKSGILYSSLSLLKVYISGSKSFLKHYHEYIKLKGHKLIVIGGSSHWPMIDNEDIFYDQLTCLKSVIK